MAVEKGSGKGLHQQRISDREIRHVFSNGMSRNIFGSGFLLKLKVILHLADCHFFAQHGTGGKRALFTTKERR